MLFDTVKLEPYTVKRALYVSDMLPLVYVNNPKGACSTIKASLWSRFNDLEEYKSDIPNNVHQKTGKPFIENILKEDYTLRQGVCSKKFFSVVRNPFSKILSAYLEKIGVDTVFKRYFCEQHQLDPDKTNPETLKFYDFLKLLKSDRVENLDPHFAPQHLNLMLEHLDYTFIGKIENMKLVGNFLSRYKVELKNIDFHKTKAAEKLQHYYCKNSIDFVLDNYCLDFYYFGYAPDINKTGCLLKMNLPTSNNGVKDILLQ